MNGKINLIIGLIFVLIFSGCGNNGADGVKVAGLFGGSGNGGTSTNSGSDQISNSPLGVTLEFAPERPPAEMYKGVASTFGLIIKNFQKHPISDLRIKTSGYETGYVSGLLYSYQVPTLNIATDSVGPFVYTGFIIDNVVIDNFDRTYNFNPKFSYCYTAKSVYREEVCVPSKDTHQANCQNTQNNLGTNGPLGISASNIQTINDNILIQFNINNRGNGNVVNKCFKISEYTNSYTLGQVKLGTTVGDCKPVSSSNIIQNTAKFTCTFKRSGGVEAFNSLITARIVYKYEQSVVKNIFVRDLAVQ